jgi:hypothetical protein
MKTYATPGYMIVASPQPFDDSGQLIGLVVDNSRFDGKKALYFMSSVRVFEVEGIKYHSVPIASVLALLEAEDKNDEDST